jgi:5-methyltetrahydropteroyltriglutamate--homocysteine methyltransferase
MKLSSDRILTTHVGSLPRTPAVLEALQKKAHGAEYDKLIADSVVEVVARQAAIGIDVVSDGETSKPSYATYVEDRLTGFGDTHEQGLPRDLLPHPELVRQLASGNKMRPTLLPCCIGPVAVADRAALKKDIENFKTATAKTKVADAFMTSASPGTVAIFHANRYYPSYGLYVEAIAEAMREEYEAIVGAGFVLQLDCPDLAASRHAVVPEAPEKEFLARIAMHVEALNHALRGVSAAAVRLHLCWGNYEGPHDLDIPLDRIIEVVLGAKPQAISFEAANPRHEHEWAVWKSRKLPEEKVLIPGVLDTCTNYVEHPELVAQRIERFVEVVGRERVIAGTDCGFGTFAGRGRIDPAVAYKKLASLVEGAAIASARLCG